MGVDGIVDPNDPEVQESLKYLLITTTEKIKLQALPFDGKKQCWIPDHKEGFLASEIESTKGEEVTVKTSKGEVLILE
jgi:myosin heavy chain 6/7